MSSTDERVNPFLTGTRGFEHASAPRLRQRHVEYRRLRARIETEGRGVWPEPEAARLYVDAVLREIEAELAARVGGMAA